VREKYQKAARLSELLAGLPGWATWLKCARRRNTLPQCVMLACVYAAM